MTIRSRRPACLIVALLLGAVLIGCNQLPLFQSADRGKRDAEPGLPSRHSFPVSQFVFVSDFELQRHLPIFRELSLLREHVYKELRLPPSSTKVLVYLFEDQNRYERFMTLKYPELPRRRAFFIAQPRGLGGSEDLLVYTYWGSRANGSQLNQDLRHELTHAMLHSVLKGVPLWLDEGLAEFFEVPASWNGINRDHVEKLLAMHTQPVSSNTPGWTNQGGEKPPANARFDMARLEKLSKIEQMTPVEYREAWAWVHLMLRTTPKARQPLLAYLQELRGNPQPSALRPRLAAALRAPETALADHLAELERGTARERVAAPVNLARLSRARSNAE